MNLFHYVKKYGLSSFQEEPFNDIDNVLFSQLSYLPLDGIVEGFGERGISLKEVSSKLVEARRCRHIVLKGIFYKKIFKLLTIMAEQERYQNISIYHYYKVIDHDRQFGAITLKLPDNSIYVSYEGTDANMSGWKEDACMTYQFPVPAQELAAQYLKKTVSRFDRVVRVGGHSKGGNLAIYAASEAPISIRKKILTVYSNDGPGFQKEFIESKKYQKIAKKIYRIVPCQSVVGMLLYHSGDMLVVKSKSKSVLQHDPFHWQIEGTSFILGILSDYSRKVSEKTKRWMENLRAQEKERCVEDLFDTIAFSDVVETYDFFSIGKSISTIREILHLEDSSKKNLIDAIKIII